jgi:mono/diheme cytochrome c family protein
MNLILTLMLAANAAAAAPAKAPQAPGQATFAKKCSACHGKDAKGSKMMAKMFKTDPENLNLTSEAARKKTDAELTKTINEGENKMPSFKGKLKDAEIAEVLSYVRSFAPKADKAEAGAK